MNRKQLLAHSSVGKHLAHPSYAVSTVKPLAHGGGTDDTEGAWGYICRRLLLPLTVALVSGAVFVTVLSLAAFNSPDPTSLVGLLSPISLGLASLSGGIAAGKCSGERAVSGSLISGCLFAAFLCVLSLFTAKDTHTVSATVMWLLRLSTVPAHLLGGILARPKKKSAAHTVGKHASHRR